MFRGDGSGVAATPRVDRADGSRHRHGSDVDIPRRRGRGAAAAATRIFRGRGSRRRRGSDADNSGRSGDGDAATATVAWIFRGDRSRQRRGRDLDIPWRRVAPSAASWRFAALTAATSVRSTESTHARVRVGAASATSVRAFTTHKKIRPLNNHRTRSRSNQPLSLAAFMASSASVVVARSARARFSSASARFNRSARTSFS